MDTDTGLTALQMMLAQATSDRAMWWAWADAAGNHVGVLDQRIDTLEAAIKKATVRAALLDLQVPRHLVGRAGPSKTELALAFGTPVSVTPIEVDGRTAPGTTIESWTRAAQTIPVRERALTFELPGPTQLRARFDAAAASDRWGGASMSDCWIHLGDPVPAAELEFTVTMETPWDFGNPATGGSGKLMGLGAWQGGRSPGGGYVGPSNFSVTAIWQGYRPGQETLALYLYGQLSDQRQLSGQIHQRAYPDGYLRLVDFRGDNGREQVRIVPGEPLGVRIGADPSAGRVWCSVKQTPEGPWVRVLDEPVTLIDPAHPRQVTHLHLRPMYGGGKDSAPLTHQWTSVLFDGLTVTEVR